MDWTLAMDVTKALAGIAAIGGGGLVLWQFFQANRTKRAQWLASLHEQFFEKGRYDRVRRALDYEAEPDYSELRSAIKNEQRQEIADDLYRYLNFFEFLAGLLRLRQISKKEVLMLFDYDLSMICRHGFVVDALRPQGFEQLHRMR